MDRETTDIEISGHSFRVKTYATALEANTIQQALFKGTKLEVVGEQPKISEFDPGVMFEMHKELVRQMVTEMDSNAEKIVDRAIELPSDAFNTLIEKLDELISKKK